MPADAATLAQMIWTVCMCEIYLRLSLRRIFMGYYDLRPYHYALRFEPDFENFTFNGAVLVQADVLKKTRILELDCADLDIRRCRLFLDSYDAGYDHVMNSKPGVICDDDDNDDGWGVVGSGDGVYTGKATYAKGGKHGRGPVASHIRGQDKNHLVIPKSLIFVDSSAERLRLKLPQGTALKKKVAILVEFTGTLNDRLLGFYRSRYKNNGKDQYLATTQFEAADARRAFPCHDRPDAKASFDVSITVRERRHTAISNMPVTNVIHGKNHSKTFQFATTPKMSTYLLYMGVGEFASSDTTYKSVSGDVVQIRIVTTKSIKKNNTVFALGCTKQLLGLYESYFGIPYPLPKLDLIAIPDFAAGAMENWGAITFRENLLLYDPKTSSSRTKQLIAEVISHELAHQWFGNLVTMKWWNDLWLNESFATFMATKLLDSVYPDWDLWKQFLADAMTTGMDLDSLRSTHPVDVPVQSPAQIREIFDPISYDKGGCILRMLEHYVGEPSFKAGLENYLKQFSYKNAQGSDLWRCIEHASGKPILRMMKSWLSKPGFPAVHLETKKHGTVLHARQTRYEQRQSTSIAGADGPPPDLWPIPFSIRMHDKDHTSTRLLSRRMARVSLDSDARRRSMVVANPGRTGFYRIVYDPNMLLDMQLLAGAGRLDATDLWALQNDLFAMCISGLASIRDYLEMIDAYRNVSDPMVLYDVIHNMSRLFRLSFEMPAAAGEVGGYAAEFGDRIHREITGWGGNGDSHGNRRRSHSHSHNNTGHVINSSSHTVSLLRGPVIALLGRIGTPHIIAKCGEFYDTLGMMSKPTSSVIAPSNDAVEPALAVRAWTCKTGNDARRVYRTLAGQYKNASSTEMKMRFLGAMCGFRDAGLLLKTLNFALSDDVRSQNTFVPVTRISENPYGAQVLWPWVQKNWNRISDKVGHGNPLLGRVIASLANTCKPSDVPKIRKFFSEHPVPGTERTLLQTAERIRIRNDVQLRIKREFGRN